MILRPRDSELEQRTFALKSNPTEAILKTLAPLKIPPKTA
jgi:hypothetical protein